jgi:sigma-B regulation protein RsbU (phosphoserine phosphatase)
VRRGPVILAIVFSGLTLLYNGVSLVAQVRPAEVEFGFNATYLPAEHLLDVTAVYPGSPAERAGLQSGDRIVAIDGRPLESASTQPDAWRLKRPGDQIRLTVVRPGQARPLTITGAFRRRVAPLGDTILSRALILYPVPFVVVGLAVLLLRVDHRNAWLLALLFAGFTAIPANPNDLSATLPVVRRLVLGYRAVLLALVGPLFYWFFAEFPARSVFERRLPWLKWIGVALGLALAVPGIAAGDLRLPRPVLGLVEEHIGAGVPFWFEFTFLSLGLVSLVLNFHRIRDPEARRKIRVIFWGTAVGVTPSLLYLGIRNAWNVQASPWLSAVLDVGLLSLFPLSIAYAVVKHRVLEIPVLIRRSARYLLVQRGFTILLALVSLALTVLFAVWIAHDLQPLVQVATPWGVALGAAFGTALVWGGSRVHQQVSGRIDRAFFRSAYDARVILEDLAERAPSVTDRDELGRLLERHLREALQPSSLVVYVRGPGDRLQVAAGSVPPDLETLSIQSPVIVGLARRARPVAVTPGEHGEASELDRLHPDCLAPMPGRGGRLAGLLVLARRLSEEPYSGEDRRLLASVARQAGTALENIALAEEIAERNERERRLAREMEIAKEVQARLLPAAPSHLRTLECAARCIQAHSVGGDGYDFLDLGDEHIGLVLADVSGKGVHAALLMANLQAYLRSLSGMAPLDLVRVLREVNRLMWNSTAGRQYATVFFGVYDERTRRLTYANCGHNPPLCLRRDGRVDRLAPTGTVIGLFDRWEGSIAEIMLGEADLLAVYSDGVTEAMAGDEEFGEDRLLNELRTHQRLPADALVATVLSIVQRFSGDSQWDDLTLLVARGKAEG